MVKILANKHVILGLSDINLELLRQGKPIKLNLSELGLPDQPIFIIHGETEQKMKEQFKEFIDPFNTVIKDDNAQNN